MVALSFHSLQPSPLRINLTMPKHSVTVTGVRRSPESPKTLAPPRLNISDLIKDEKMFAIYVQAIRGCFFQATRGPASNELFRRILSGGGLQGREGLV